MCIPIDMIKWILYDKNEWQFEQISEEDYDEYT